MADLEKIYYGENKRAHGSWYRGENCNFIADKEDLKKETSIYDYILKGWVPEEPISFIDKKIVAFGSCFAAHISKFLYRKGYNVLSSTSRQNSHVVSYGAGINNTFAIRQQFEWAFENKKFSENLWYNEDKEFVGYDSSIQENTKKLFEQADIFIITLGLSEVWYNKQTEEVFWRAIPKSKFNELIHGFKVSSVEENKDNLNKIIEIIHKYKPKSLIVFTLSPVPLVATFRPVSCITASSVSKSILRVALDEVLRDNKLLNKQLFYFPSYEIVKDFYGSEAYKEDNRHIRKSIVNSIMLLFEKYFIKNEEQITRFTRLKFTKDGFQFIELIDLLMNIIS